MMHYRFTELSVLNKLVFCTDSHTATHIITLFIIVLMSVKYFQHQVSAMLRYIQQIKMRLISSGHAALYDLATVQIKHAISKLQTSSILFINLSIIELQAVLLEKLSPQGS